MLNLPNLVSFVRILMVPVAIYLIINGRLQAAFFVFVIAAISDAVDGWLAKRFGLESELGAYLDPLADKLLIVSIFISLGYYGEIPIWLVLAVVSRDIIMVIAILLSWMLGNPIAMRPILLSKINTTLQLVLVATVLADAGFGLGFHGLRAVLAWATGLTTILSAAAYLKLWAQHMAGYKISPPEA